MSFLLAFWWSEEHAQFYRAIIKASPWEFWLGSYQSLTLAALQRCFKIE